MVDGAVVMIENAHKHLERWRHAHGAMPQGETSGASSATPRRPRSAPRSSSACSSSRCRSCRCSCWRRRKALVLAARVHQDVRDGGRGRIPAITLIPVLMGYLIRGPHPGRGRTRSTASDRDLPSAARRRAALPNDDRGRAAGVASADGDPARQLGGEFLPPLDEGDLLYMPSAGPRRLGQAAELLQQTTRLIARACRKSRACSARPARGDRDRSRAASRCSRPRSSSPRDQWRFGMTPTSSWPSRPRGAGARAVEYQVPPIRNRIDIP